MTGVLIFFGVGIMLASVAIMCIAAWRAPHGYQSDGTFKHGEPDDDQL